MSVNGSAPAIQCGISFYGADHVLFGTDCPFDPEGGPMFIRETIKALDKLPLKEGDRRKIYFGNAMRMLKLELPVPPAARKPARKAAEKNAKRVSKQVTKQVTKQSAKKAVKKTPARAPVPKKSAKK